MKIALIFNPFKYKVHEENIRIVQKYFGLFPPLSLAWTAAIAEKAGHEAKIIDARTRDLSKKETLRILQQFRPDVIGFMLTTYMYRDTLEWIKYLKKNMGVTVIVGGYNLRIYPKESVMAEEIDFGVREHALYTLPALLKELAGEKKFDRVPGLVYKNKGKIISTAQEQKINFNDFPYPARHLLPNELYAEFPTERRNFTVMITSLGCPHKCFFCEAGGTLYSPRSPQKVADEMQECYEKYRIREIDIFDYDFTVMRPRVEEICDKIIKKKIDITWCCRSRIDNVDDSLLKKMYAAGCRRIYYGIESGDQRILDHINKGITLKQIEDTISLTKKNKIKSLGFFLIGAPGDTKETVKRTIKFSKKLGLEYAQFSKCLAKPLTPLWRENVEKEKKDYWKDWLTGEETDRALPRPWTELTNEEVDALARKAYFSFILRPGYLLKLIIKLGSFKEFVRKVSAFFDILLSQEKVSKHDYKFKAFNENKYFRKERPETKTN